MKPGSTHDNITRALISERTRQAMAAPEVRQRVSERTEAGMARASGMAAERAALALACLTARSAARRLFLEELLAPLSSGSDAVGEDHDSARQAQD
jgi:hypothetical protein